MREGLDKQAIEALTLPNYVCHITCKIKGIPLYILHLHLCLYLSVSVSIYVKRHTDAHVVSIFLIKRRDSQNVGSGRVDQEKNSRKLNVL